MATVLILCSLGLMGGSVLGLINPLRFAQGSRARAFGVGVIGFALLMVGGAMLPPTPEPTSTATSSPPEPVQESESSVDSDEPASGNLTAAQRNAVRSANSYLQLSGFSRQGLIDQLSSEFGDRYSVGDATVAVDSLSTDWNAQAARSAVSYLELSGFSCQGLIDQLSSEAGDKYTVEQATYGATQAGIC